MRQIIFSLVTAVVAFACIGSATAQDYPSKAVRYIVPNSPGTLIDLTARIIGPEMSKALGQPVIVDNRSSADGIIGYEAIAKSPADGYTLGSALVGELVILPLTRKDLRFDPLKDLPPLIAIADARFILASTASVPWKSFNEMVSVVKANPGKYNFGISSIVGRLYTEAIVRDLGLNIVQINYKSGGAYLQAAAAGEFHTGFIGESAMINLGDKVRAVAVTGQTRLGTFPNAPTFAEMGLLRTRNNTFSLHAPAGLPKGVSDKLFSVASAALKQPEVKAQYDKIKLEVVSQGPDAAARNMADTARLFAEIAKSINLQPE